MKSSFLTIGLGFVLLLSLLGACSSQEQEKEEASKRVTILYFNDFHGHLLPFKRFYGDEQLSGGIARIAFWVKKIRAENDIKGIDTLLFSGGDNIQGTPISTAFKGEVEISAFNLIQLDASVVGNHDFDFGFDNLMKLKQLAKFPFLSANIHKPNSLDPVFKATKRIKTKHGLRVGVIGLTTPETTITTHPRNVANLRFSPPALAMQMVLSSLDKKTDLLVVLSHLGITQDKQIAGDYPEIDVIIGGHTHTLLSDPLYVGQVMVTQAGDRGLYLGRLDLEIKDDRARMISSSLIPIRDYSPEDTETKLLVEKYQSHLSAEITKKIGETNQVFDGERASIRTQETNLGDLITDLIRIYTKTDVVLLNSGAIRASLLPKVITMENIMMVFPMNNEIVTMELTGQELLYALTRSVKGAANMGPGEYFGGFLQVSGVRFSAKNGKVQNVTVNDKPLDFYRTYKVATIDFLAAGGDGYKELQEGVNRYEMGVTLRDLIIDHLRDNPVLRKDTDGRIQTK